MAATTAEKIETSDMIRSRSSDSEVATYRLMAVVAVLAFLVSLAVVWLPVYAEFKNGVEFCGGRQPVELWQPIEQVEITSTPGYIPLGYTCTYTAPDGTTVTIPPPAGLTVGAIASLLTLALALFAFTRSGRRSHTSAESVKDATSGPINRN
jgi:hypothetical protein